MDGSTGYSRLFSGTLTRTDSHTFKRFEFFVPPGASEVMLRLTYAPRREELQVPLTPQEFRGRWSREIARYRGKVEMAGDHELAAFFERFVDEASRRVQPLQNLLNVAVFDSRGSFRGRWDSPQHFGQWVTVGEAHAARGFVAGAIPPGKWTAVLECHAVVTDTCSYELEVRCATFAGLYWRGELHAHTNHSDGMLSPRELVDAAHEAGLDFIAVTDHNTVSALYELGAVSAADAPDAAGAGDSCGPLVIPGMELTTFYGHAVALDVSEFIPWHDASKGDGLNKQAREVRRIGGLFSIAHPFSVGYPVCAGCEWEYDNTDPALVDLMEVWSGPWTARIMWNVLAMRWWDELLCKGYRITGVAARDVHRREDLFGRETADTYVWARSLSRGELMDSLRTGRVYVSSGPRLDFSLAVGDCDRPYMPGDRVQVTRGGRVGLGVRVLWPADAADDDGRHPHARARANAHADAGRLVARVVRGVRGQGANVAFESPLLRDGDGRVEFEDAPVTDAWYRCEIVADSRSGFPGPRFVALTNPIYAEVISSETC